MSEKKEICFEESHGEKRIMLHNTKWKWMNHVRNHLGRIWIIWKNNVRRKQSIESCMKNESCEVIRLKRNPSDQNHIWESCVKKWIVWQSHILIRSESYGRNTCGKKWICRWITSKRNRVKESQIERDESEYLNHIWKNELYESITWK